MSEVRPWTLRFVSQQAEEGYLLRSQAGLIWRTELLSWSGLFALVALGVPFALMFPAPQSGFQEDLEKAEMGVNAAFVILFVLPGLAMRLSKRWVQRVKPRALEAVIVAWAALVMLLCVLGDRMCVCKLLGYSIKEVFGQEDQWDSDSWAVLAILGINMAVHLSSPLRWCSLLPLEIASVALYMVYAYVIGSSEPLPNVLCNNVLLATLIAASSMGKRAAESLERKAFLDVIREKAMRCRAEFQLSVVQESNSRGHAERPATSAAESSVAARTGSSQAFDPRADGDTPVADCLARMAQLGETEHWRLEGDQVTVLEDEVLGSGGFGEVVKGIFCGKLVAVKRPRIKPENTDAQTLADICNELRVIRHLRHPNIVTSFGAIIRPDQPSVALVMELVDGVRLADLMRAAARDPLCELSLLKRFQIMVGICQALCYMHSMKPSIVHGDLKGQNIMVTLGRDFAHPRLLDFGLSRVLTRSARRLGGTLAWMAPEVGHRGAAKCSADVYSFGHLIAFVATGIPPGHGVAAEVLARILRRSMPLAPTWPDACAFRPSCEPLVSSCVARAEGDRPKIDGVLRSLLRLPQEEALAEMRGAFTESLQVVARLALRDAESSQSRGEQLGPAPPMAEDPGPGTFRHGTNLPPLPEGHAAAEEGQREPVPPQQTRPARLRPYPNLKETCLESRAATLDGVLARWNYQTPKKFCCERHALAQLAIDTLHESRMAKPCDLKRLHRPDQPEQCFNCGLLLHADTTGCDACGFDPCEWLAAPEVAPSSSHLRTAL